MQKPKRQKNIRRKKKNLDLIFHILHSLTSGSTWDNTSTEVKKKTQNNNNI